MLFKLWEFISILILLSDHDILFAYELDVLIILLYPVFKLLWESNQKKEKGTKEKDINREWQLEKGQENWKRKRKEKCSHSKKNHKENTKIYMQE